MIRSTQSDFLEKAKAKHGNRYDYSLVDYVNNRTHVKIICSVHGVFEQAPDMHTNNRARGCPECSGCKRYTTMEYIEKAVSIHGLTYDYSLTNYVNVRTPIIIVCKKHGAFEKHPSTHINVKKSGCPRCECVNYKIDGDEFIQRAKDNHGERYDYSQVIYKNDHTKVKIICSEHGVFEQRPNSHLKGNGCITCSGRYQYSTADFLNKAQQVHGDVYDYSLVSYGKAHDKVSIICEKHGIFEQRAYSHLAGNGCTTCLSSKGELRVMEWLNIHNVKYIVQHKFDDCKLKYRLRFDFFLEDYNTCIEYDGEFHFMQIFGEKQFLDQLARDQAKDNYCEKHGIKLIRIMYTDFENIEKILNTELI